MDHYSLASLRNIIRRDFAAMYEVNDAAHRLPHFSAVEECGNRINETLGLGYSPKLIMLVAHWHDLFAWSRNNHHDLSATWVRTSDYAILEELDPVERELVAIGCQEHRASRTDPFTHGFGELMNAADRELPGDVGAMLERAIQFRMARGCTRDEALKPAVEHLKDKFGPGGYARYPKLYQFVFWTELEAQREEIKNL